MWWAIVLAMQSAAGPPNRPAVARPATPVRCNEGQAGDVVVCGARDQEAFRLRPLPERYASVPGLPRAETTILGDLKVSADAEAGQAIGPAPPRAMVRFKLPF